MNKFRFIVATGVVLATLAVVASADGQTVDLSKGRQRAEVCMACHGKDGFTTAAPGIPHLAGQDRDYLIKALNAYRAATTRTDETMTAMAKPLSNEDITDIAAFFSSLPGRNQ